MIKYGLLVFDLGVEWSSESGMERSLGKYRVCIVQVLFFRCTAPGAIHKWFHWSSTGRPAPWGRWISDHDRHHGICCARGLGRRISFWTAGEWRRVWRCPCLNFYDYSSWVDFFRRNGWWVYLLKPMRWWVYLLKLTAMTFPWNHGCGVEHCSGSCWIEHILWTPGPDANCWHYQFH